jgi:hypothetical protein
MKWTEDMNDQLGDLVQRFGENWKEISKFFGGLDVRKLRDHWNQVSKSSRLPFSNEEDAKILEYGGLYVGHWRLLAWRVGTGRTALQIRNRYAQLVAGLHNKPIPYEELPVQALKIEWDEEFRLVQ